MAARQNTAKRALTHNTTSVPKGARIPHPALVSWILRAIIIGALAVFFAHPFILEWAMVHESAGSAADQDQVALVLVAFTVTVFTPRVVTLLGVIGVLGVSMMAVELALAIWGMWRQRRAVPGTPTTYLLVRATIPSSAAGRVGGTSSPSGDQFYRALLKELTAGTRSERHAGTAPWVAFTLTGLPDQP